MLYVMFSYNSAICHALLWNYDMWCFLMVLSYVMFWYGITICLVFGMVLPYVLFCYGITIMSCFLRVLPYVLFWHGITVCHVLSWYCHSLSITLAPPYLLLSLQASKPETVQLEDRHRNASGRSAGSYGALDAAGRRATMRRQGSSTILKRTSSTATTDKPFERPEIRSIVSGKSMTSIRTRRTSVSRSEYHDDLKPTIVSVSGVMH